VAQPELPLLSSIPECENPLKNPRFLDKINLCEGCAALTRKQGSMLGKQVAAFAPGPLRGELRVPGDKSVSHRALIAAASLDAPVRVAGLNPGRDVLATRRALERLGVRIASAGGETLVHGPVRRAASPPTLDCMNSGSTARMLLGLCAGADLPARFDGDASLRARPMEPVAAQLRAFGARIETTGGCLPLEHRGRPAVETRNFILLSPSAQVKSALLFAALFARVAISITGDRGSRDHTERLLRFLGANIAWDGKSVTLENTPLRATDLTVPGDFSAAAFFITAAAITPGSRLVVRGTGANPTRTGLLDALRRMGARIELHNRSERCGEPIADIAVEHAPLRSIDVDPDLALRAIDEIPLLCVAAAFARGQTAIAGIRDLRTKESDRVAAIQQLLGAVGIQTLATRNQLSIAGGTPTPCNRVIQTYGDHRIAMTAAVLACAAGPVEIDSDASIDVSFPDFIATLRSVRG
jgi:3-phosphoshikimate 1-carboxyvinyltransferase